MDVQAPALPFSVYGAAASAVGETNHEVLRQLAESGFAILPGVLDQQHARDLSQRLEVLYERQCGEVGIDVLAAIQDLDVVRLPLADDEAFLELAKASQVLEVVRSMLGEYVCLHLQNGVINRPEAVHRQAAWHRDLPHQRFVSSRPLAVSVLFSLCEFTATNGATVVLPQSHRAEDFPAEAFVRANEHVCVAPAGSAIIFDAMLFHRGGWNTTSAPRIGVNHVYTTGIIKQQIDIPRALNGRWSEDPFLRVFLGYDSQPATSAGEWRRRRLARKG